MKKVIIILAIALFASCTPEETTTSTDCNCGQIVQSNSFNIINGTGGITVFSVLKVKDNCTGEIVTIQRNGTYANNTQICNY